MLYSQCANSLFEQLHQLNREQTASTLEIPHSGSQDHFLTKNSTNKDEITQMLYAHFVLPSDDSECIGILQLVSCIHIGRRTVDHHVTLNFDL